MVWYNMVCMVWYGMVWYGMVWCPHETRPCSSCPNTSMAPAFGGPRAPEGRGGEKLGRAKGGNGCQAGGKEAWRGGEARREGMVLLIWHTGEGCVTQWGIG